MFYKIINVCILGIGFLFLGACSLNLRVPNSMPPQVIVPPQEEIQMEESATQNPSLDPGRNILVEVLLPDSERKTEALLEQYRQNLEDLEKNLD